MTVSVPRCNDVLSFCLNEIHALQVGLFVGLLVAWLAHRDARGAALVVAVTVVVAVTQPIHHIIKPWWVLAAVVAGVGLGEAALAGLATVRGESPRYRSD